VKLAYWWVIALLCVLAAGWLIVRTFHITPSPVKRGTVAVLATAFAVVSVYVSATFGLPDRSIPWQDYSPELYSRHLEDRKVVVLDFTADWCLNCKTIEAAVLHRAAVVKALNAADVAPVKVDLTKPQAAGWRKLKEFNEVGIPLLVVMTSGSPDPVLKSNAYTPDQVIEAINRARSFLGQRTAASGKPERAD
jgi:thiol:disulfide interchange protein